MAEIDPKMRSEILACPNPKYIAKCFTEELK